MAKKKNTKRADGRYAVQVYLGLDENKKRKYKTVYGNTQKEADKKANTLKEQLKKGIDITAEYDNFEKWADNWLMYKRMSVEDGQYNSYKSAINYLKNGFGNRQLTKVNPSNIQKVVNKLYIKNPNTKKPSSKRTLEGIVSTAKQVFDYAIDNRVIDFNPAKIVDVPKDSTKNKRRAITNEEIKYIEEMPHRAQRTAMIALYAGLRRGEIIPLTWGDINLNDATIKVDKAVTLKDNKMIIKPFTKTAAGMRLVSIPNILIDFLKKEKEKDIQNFKNDKIIKPIDYIIICRSAKGKIMSYHSFKRMWESYMTDLNLKYGNCLTKTSKYDPHGIVKTFTFGVHDLRHTYATILYKAGVDVLTAKEQMGHSDIKTTLSIYTHLDSQFKKKEINKLNNYLCKSDASQEVSERA